MKHALFALIVRTLQSINASFGSDEFAKIIEVEAVSTTVKWRKFVSQAIDHIRDAYKMEDRRYRQREQQPLPIVNFFKSRAYISKVFPSAMSQTLKAVARKVV